MNLEPELVFALSYQNVAPSGADPKPRKYPRSPSQSPSKSCAHHGWAEGILYPETAHLQRPPLGHDLLTVGDGSSLMGVVMAVCLLLY